MRDFGGGTCTWSDWHREARAYAAALIDSGCMPGDTVAILAGNSTLWPIAEMGALMAGCISVGLCPTNTAVQAHERLSDCGARVLVVDHADQLRKVMQMRATLPNLRVVVSAARSHDSGVVDWPDWIKQGHGALARVERELNDRILDATPDDVAILIYTSGATGPPKGVRISHRYLSASAETIRSALELTCHDSTVSYLPFCHVAERVFGLYTRIHCGMSVTLIDDLANLWEAARSVEPTFFLGVPRLYQAIFEALQVQPDAASRQAIVEQMLGRKVRVAINGGAMLPEEVASALTASGLNLLTVYGMTEQLCITMQRPGTHDFSSAGKPVDGVTLRISEQGEVQVERSALTFSGYLNKPLHTSVVFTADKAWLRTGDIGYIDAAGCLHLTGRQLDEIVLADGARVAPAPIERRLTASPWIAQAVLFGRGRQYLSALLILRPRVVERWAVSQGLRMDEYITLEPALIAQVQAEIDAVNGQLEPSEQVRRFAILPDDLSIERDELTVTMKVRRDVVAERYRGHIESLYT